MLACASSPALNWAQSVKPLEIGVLPNINSRTLMLQYAPLRMYLEQALQRPVQISSAPSWSTFHQRTRQLEYDVIVTAAHLARIAQLDFGYMPLLFMTPKIRGLVIFAKERPFNSIADIRGKMLVLSNPQSLVTLRGINWLAENGLRRNIDFTTIETKTDDSVGNVLVRGEAIAAILSGGEFRAIPEVIKGQLQLFTTFAEVPGFVVMATPKMSIAESAALKDQLMKFSQSPDHGKAYFDNTGFTGMLELSPGFMEAMDLYADATRKLLANPG